MLTADKDTLRRDRAALEMALKEAGATVRGKEVACPFHNDATPSASVYEGKDGCWRFRCHAGDCGFHGDLFDVEARATGKTLTEVLKARGCVAQRPLDLERKNLKVYPTLGALREAARYQGHDEPPLTLEREFTNSDPDTRRVDLIVFRLVRSDGKKTFRQACQHGDGWAMKRPDGTLPLYNRARLRAAAVAIVVEGEKCVHAMTDAALPPSFAATTSPCGAGKAALADWTPLRGKEVVYLWPDRDDAGDRHMRDVAAILGRLNPAPDIRLIDPEAVGLTEPGDDVADYLAALGGDTPASKCDAINAALATARPLCASADLQQRIEDAIAGKFATVPWPWDALSRLTKALMPGTVTLLCGDPGATKSFLLLQAALHWIANGVPVALFELEEDAAFWQNRVLAMAAGNANLTDADWMKHNPDAARAAYATHRSELDRFARRLSVAGDKQIAHAEPLTWIRQQAEAGCRVIAVDPVTALTATERPWLDDLKFMMEAKAIAGRYGCSLVFVTHPRTRRAKSGSPLDDLAGGAAYTRFAQTVLWVNSYPQGKKFRWRTMAGVYCAKENRSVKIAKARNAAGGGLEIVLHFDGEALRFQERGVVTKETEADEDSTS